LGSPAYSGTLRAGLAMRLLPLLAAACCNLKVVMAVESRGRSQHRGGHVPWAAVRALVGSSQPARTTQAFPPMLGLAPPTALAPAPAPSPLVAGAPGATVAMPKWAHLVVSDSMGSAAAVAASPGAAPAAAVAAVAAGPGGAPAGPCHACLPQHQQPGAVVNKDLQDVATDQAGQEVEEAAEEAEKDAEHAIAAEGKKSLRGVQAANENAIGDSSAALKASAEAQQNGMEADSQHHMTAAEHEAHVSAEFEKFLTSEDIKKGGAKTSAKYIADARTAVLGLVHDIHAAGKDMNKWLKNAAGVGETSTNVTERYVKKKQKQSSTKQSTSWTRHFMRSTLPKLMPIPPKNTFAPK